MRLLHSIQHKACADGTYMKEYVLDEALTPDFFAYLKFFGRVEMITALGDGYFSFRKPNWFSIKGFVGDNTVEVRFVRESMDITLDFLRMLFLRFHAGMSAEEIRKIKEAEAMREEAVVNACIHSSLSL